MLGVGILGWQKTSVPQSCHPGTAMLGARSSAESPQTLSDDLYQASLESPYWPKFLAKNVTKLTSAAFSWKYLTCPRRYRHRYLDGWQEKDVRAAMLFGRCFEQAVAALFRHEDPAAVLFEQWAPCKDLKLVYSGNDTWDHMLRQGIQLLERFVQDGRVQIRQPRTHQQIRFTRTLSSGDSFVAFVDAIGELDTVPCVLEWKTSSARYPEEPDGIAALDPQLVCYSWMTGIEEVAQVVFVRKRTVEVQYLRASITDQQREDFAILVGYGAQDRVWTVPAAQRHSLPPEPVYHLSLPRALPRPARSGGVWPDTQAGSRPWSV